MVWFITLPVPWWAEYGRHHENIVWHVPILVSDWINHPPPEYFMFSSSEAVMCFFLNCQNVPTTELLLTLINSMILFLFCLENLVKMELTQKTR